MHPYRFDSVLGGELEAEHVYFEVLGPDLDEFDMTCRSHPRNHLTSLTVADYSEKRLGLEKEVK